jgi:hypothetical protein
MGGAFLLTYIRSVGGLLLAQNIFYTSLQKWPATGAAHCTELFPI